MLEFQEQREFFLDEVIQIVNSTLEYENTTSDIVKIRIKESKHLINSYLSPLYFNGGLDTNYSKAQEKLQQISMIVYIICDLLSYFEDKKLSKKIYQKLFDYFLGVYINYILQQKIN